MIWWLSLAGLYLLILTYQDLKNKMWVDERLNWYMLGATTALVMVSEKPFWWILGSIVIGGVLTTLLKKTNTLGAADLQTFFWLYPGLGIIGWDALFLYGFVQIIITGVLFFIAKFIIKKDLHSPYYPTILGSYIIVCAFMFIPRS